MATRRKTITGTLNQDKLDYSTSQYNKIIGLDEMEEYRDKDGFIRLQYSAETTDKQIDDLTTNIATIEEKLKAYKKEKAEKEKYRKSDDYKESKKLMSKKKRKKSKSSLLEMVFNNADQEQEELEENMEEDGGTLTDKKPRKKPSSTTLNNTYGKRFSPVVGMLHDTIMEFDDIAAEIEQDLKDYRSSSRTMYRSSQISNLISAKNSKLSAVKELTSVAKTVSDLEYKKEKDKKDSQQGDVSREISTLGAKFLRGSFDIYDNRNKKKGKGKDEKKKMKASIFSPGNMDDDDDDDSSIKHANRSNINKEESDHELAVEFTKALERNKDKITFTPAERYVSMEGKYNVVVIADALDLENTWRFAAIDNKSGKEIHGFKDEYPGLLPRKKKCRMKFDLSRMKCTDLNSARTYKLVVKD